MVSPFSDNNLSCRLAASGQAGEHIQPTAFTQEKSSVVVLDPESWHVVEEVNSSLLDGVLQPGVKQDVTSQEVRRMKQLFCQVRQMLSLDGVKRFCFWLLSHFHTLFAGGKLRWVWCKGKL